MSSDSFNLFELQKPINAPKSENVDSTHWLNYGIELLQALQPEDNAIKQQQQAAIALAHAQKEGATPQQVSDSLRMTALECIQQALKSAEINSNIKKIKST